MPDVIDEFWSVNLEDDWIAVSHSNADKINDQIEREAKLLRFEDLYGAAHVIPVQCFLGMHWSTPAYRAIVCEHNTAMKAERGPRQWSEGDEG